MQKKKIRCWKYSIRFNKYNGFSLPVFLTILFFFLFRGSFLGQQVNFQNFGTRENLSSNQVYQIYQDKNGVMWFATDRGLSSYNGYEFKQYGLNDGLTSTTILAFFPQKNGDIWCSTIENRLFYFNPDDCIFHEYKYNGILDNISRGSISNELHIDEKGTLRQSYLNCHSYAAIGKKGEILTKPVHYNTRVDSLKSEILTKVMNDGIPFSYIDEIKTGNDTSVSVNNFSTAETNFTRYARISIGTTVIYNDINSTYLIQGGKLVRQIKLNATPISIGEFDSSHFWVGYRSGGVRIYNLNGDLVKHFLSDQSVTHVLVDHENSFWVSTLSSGVYYSPNLQYSSYQLDEKEIFHLSSGKNNSLRMETVGGKMYDELNGQLVKFEIHSNFPILRNHYDGFGELVRAQEFNTDKKYLNLTFNGNSIYWMGYITSFSDESDELPILCASNLFWVIESDRTPKKYFVPGRINDACFVGDLIYLAKNDGLFAYDTLNRKERKVNGKDLNCRITDIDRFRKTSVVAATRGKGVYIYTQGKGLWITEKKGLTSDLVTEVYIDNDSTIWACTNLGLNRIVLRPDGSFKINTITQENGLIDNDITDVVVLKGIVWVGTRRGLSSFPLNELNVKSLHPKMFLRFTRIKVNDKIVKRLNELSFDENRIEINYQAISFKMKGLMYRYRLKGLGSKWNETKNLKVVYDALAPGYYLFQVQAGFNGEWFGNELGLPLHISPPYYQSWWFRTLLILATGGLIYLFFRYRILVYNRNIIREILRQFLKRIKKETATFVVESNNKLIKINSPDVLYVQSHRNYIEIRTKQDRVLIREKISNFRSMVPDPIEYVQINRSCIVRIDNVSAKTKNSLIVNQQEFKIGSTYLDSISKIHF